MGRVSRLFPAVMLWLVPEKKIRGPPGSVSSHKTLGAKFTTCYVQIVFFSFFSLVFLGIFSQIQRGNESCRILSQKSCLVLSSSSSKVHNSKRASVSFFFRGERRERRGCGTQRISSFDSIFLPWRWHPTKLSARLGVKRKKTNKGGKKRASSDQFSFLKREYFRVGKRCSVLFFPLSLNMNLKPE